jgi:hypothetical protein
MAFALSRRQTIWLGTGLAAVVVVLGLATRGNSSAPEDGGPRARTGS